MKSSAASIAEQLADEYTGVRRFTEKLCEGLAAEDYVVQSMPDVSPTKWHLAHTSWFFETFVVQPNLPAYRPLDEKYAYLFNSYYVNAGERHCRAQRGYLSRPTVAEVYDYRHHVDEAIRNLLAAADESLVATLKPLITLGLNHEQQHQELLLADLKHVFSVNPLRPVYRDLGTQGSSDPGEIGWLDFPGGLEMIGHDGKGFAYDNEGPKHRQFVEPFALASRLVTSGEFLDFMNDGGYRRPDLWLSMGWATAQENEWTEPFYWERRDGEWWVFTLGGMRRIDPHEPVCHLSYFEADAFARWAGARLPTEAEWEVAARSVPIEGSFADGAAFHPATADPVPTGLQQMYGDVWEWTRSQYSPYPRYAPAEGALGEYNGKFMCNQFVLRGGSCATSRSHIRPTYRNFFPPEATWQFTGARLARNA
ncbi:MAG: ergothioneine biosynthesis protein EgtB [Gemmatimonas sp.]|nr:ergothioneine biosynthesis protein EgtB [Gemmatimonas sp.]